MKVVIAGGHGKIALLLTRRLQQRGDQVVSLVRDAGQSAEIEAAGGKPLVLDLEDADAGEIAERLGSADAIVFAAGAGPDSGPERKETVDYGAAAKLVDVGRKLQIQRYVMVSSIGADASHEGDENFDVYLRAKGRADQALIDSGLDYVIIRPGMLTDDEGSGQVEAGSSVERGKIPREDVAEVLAGALRSETAGGRVIEVVSGETPVSEALASV